MTILVYDEDGKFVTKHSGSKSLMKKKMAILESLGYTVIIEN